MKNTLRKMIPMIMIVVLAVALTGCAKEEKVDDGKLSVITTTTMLADLARVIGGDLVNAEALMGPGIDPHLYNASAGDVSKMTDADLVVYNGLHLEGKMGEIFENLKGGEKAIVEIVEGIDESELVTDEATGAHDPHIWFDVELWNKMSVNLYNGLVELDPDNEAIYTENYNAYKEELNELDAYIITKIEEVAADKRILVTAHDAFSYFGKAYGFEVLGLQGISTTSEAGTADVTELATFIVDNQIKAIFVESSVPKKNVEALQEAVAAQGFDVLIGGELYSDSLGTPGTEAETFIGTVTDNVNTIVNALK